MALVKSEMAGTVLSVSVKVGDKIKAGQEIAVLESMKMEVPLQSNGNGTVAKILKKPGEFVNEGEAALELS